VAGFLFDVLPYLSYGSLPLFAVLLAVLIVARPRWRVVIIEIGGSGGVFAPSLFMGAMFGTAFGPVMRHLGRLGAGQQRGLHTILDHAQPQLPRPASANG
jgi:H+/Cl- antiporter ClcA